VITIDELRPDDWPRWRELRLAALAESPDAYGSKLSNWQGDNDTEQRWRARLADVAYNVLAALDGVPVGIASGTADTPVELISMWVAPGARGRGVGDALVRAVLRWAERRGVSVRLAVREQNTKAIELYRRHGFVIVGEEPATVGEPRELTMVAEPVTARR
jgi:ribosomal protein S18 acetylase RimI-like enzyme